MAMFSFLKPKTSKPLLRLFQVNVHIERGTNTEMPPKLAGAHVPVFVGGEDHESGVMKAVASLTARGFKFLDIADRHIHELDPQKWDAFIREVWPDYVGHFPTQSEVISRLQTEFLCTGPFAGYEVQKGGKSA